MIRRPPKSTLSSSSAASDVYKRQVLDVVNELLERYLGMCDGLQACKAWGKSVQGRKAHVLVFCHGGVIKEINNICLQRADMPNSAKNTSLWRYQFRRSKVGQLKVAPYSLVNSTNHLKALEVESPAQAWEGELHQVFNLPPA
eukprot:TRINITY_DN23105_c0_g1_i1.p2 TRINITY_DN23105_c0_g1~~TRINITY_DN23105_c0_g1_i1.p2  ORF type:complete len:143 (+),score=26.66 TRINITY_DN23105_c0_g1_i1:111-539(+)